MINIYKKDQDHRKSFSAADFYPCLSFYDETVSRNLALSQTISIHDDLKNNDLEREAKVNRQSKDETYQLCQMDYSTNHTDRPKSMQYNQKANNHYHRQSFVTNSSVPQELDQVGLNARNARYLREKSASKTNLAMESPLVSCCHHKQLVNKESKLSPVLTDVITHISNDCNKTGITVKQIDIQTETNDISLGLPNFRQLPTIQKKPRIARTRMFFASLKAGLKEYIEWQTTQLQQAELDQNTKLEHLASECLSQLEQRLNTIHRLEREYIKYWKIYEPQGTPASESSNCNRQPHLDNSLLRKRDFSRSTTGLAGSMQTETLLHRSSTNQGSRNSSYLPRQPRHSSLLNLFKHKAKRTSTLLSLAQEQKLRADHKVHQAKNKQNLINIPEYEDFAKYQNIERELAAQNLCKIEAQTEYLSGTLVCEAVGVTGTPTTLAKDTIRVSLNYGTPELSSLYQFNGNKCELRPLERFDVPSEQTPVVDNKWILTGRIGPNYKTPPCSLHIDGMNPKFPVQKWDQAKRVLSPTIGDVLTMKAVINRRFSKPELLIQQACDLINMLTPHGHRVSFALKDCTDLQFHITIRWCPLADIKDDCFLFYSLSTKPLHEAHEDDSRFLLEDASNNQLQNKHDSNDCLLSNYTDSELNIHENKILHITPVNKSGYKERRTRTKSSNLSNWKSMPNLEISYVTPPNNTKPMKVITVRTETEPIRNDIQIINEAKDAVNSHLIRSSKTNQSKPTKEKKRREKSSTDSVSLSDTLRQLEDNVDTKIAHQQEQFTHILQDLKQAIKKVQLQLDINGKFFDTPSPDDLAKSQSIIRPNADRREQSPLSSTQLDDKNVMKLFLESLAFLDESFSCDTPKDSIVSKSSYAEAQYSLTSGWCELDLALKWHLNYTKKLINTTYGDTKDQMNTQATGASGIFMHLENNYPPLCRTAKDGHMDLIQNTIPRQWSVLALIEQIKILNDMEVIMKQLLQDPIHAELNYVLNIVGHNSNTLQLHEKCCLFPLIWPSKSCMCDDLSSLPKDVSRPKLMLNCNALKDKLLHLFTKYLSRKWSYNVEVGVVGSFIYDVFDLEMNGRTTLTVPLTQLNQRLQLAHNLGNVKNQMTFSGEQIGPLDSYFLQLLSYLSVQACIQQGIKGSLCSKVISTIPHYHKALQPVFQLNNLFDDIDLDRFCCKYFSKQVDTKSLDISVCHSTRTWLAVAGILRHPDTEIVQKAITLLKIMDLKTCNIVKLLVNYRSQCKVNLQPDKEAANLYRLPIFYSIGPPLHIIYAMIQWNLVEFTPSIPPIWQSLLWDVQRNSQSDRSSAINALSLLIKSTHSNQPPTQQIVETQSSIGLLNDNLSNPTKAVLKLLTKEANKRTDNQTVGCGGVKLDKYDPKPKKQSSIYDIKILRPPRPTKN